jgi:hypothetical protein
MDRLARMLTSLVRGLARLLGLPLLVSRYAGPVRPRWAPRLVRVGGRARGRDPTGRPLHPTRPPHPGPASLLATTGAMATAILVVLFTTLTIALSPHHFTVPQQPAGDGTCPTCEPSTTIVPPNLRHEYSFEASVNGAGDGTTALLIVPLIGATLGALRGHLRYPPPATRPVGLPERA